MTVFAKGQPPEDLLGILWLWWRTPAINWDGPTWGTLVSLAVMVLGIACLLHLISRP